MTIDQHIAAGIDLGSNTFRLLVAIYSAGKLSVLDKKLATVSLARSMQGDLMHERAMERGLKVLRTFREDLNQYELQSIRICGTEALRQAKNSSHFLNEAEKILGNKIDIISGEEEAHLSLAGAIAGSREEFPGNILLVDVGGGSTELLYTDRASGETRVESMGLGVVNLTEKFLAKPHADITAMNEVLTKTIGNALEKLDISAGNPAVNIIGCGGTATSMGALDLKLASYKAALVHGHILEQKNIEKLWNSLIVLPVEKRNRLPCLGQGRGEILPAGIRIYQVLLELLKLKRMQVSDTGLLEGILLSSIPGIFSPWGT